MKRSSRNALIIVSVAGGIIIGFLGFIWALNKAFEKAFKNFDIEDMSFEENHVTEPEICDDDSDNEEEMYL